MIKKLIEFGIYCLIILLPWQTRWIIYSGTIGSGISEYLTYSLYVSDLILITLLLAAVIYKWKNILSFSPSLIVSIKNNSVFSKINLKSGLILLIMILGIFSLLVAGNKSLAMFAQSRIILAVGFFWLILNFTDKIKSTVCFVASLFLPAILAIWQFLAQQTFANKWLGLAYHPAYAGGSSVIETYSDGIVDGRWLRAYGSFDHPNVLGGAMTIGIIFTIWLLTKFQSSSRLEKHSNFAKKIALIFLLIIQSAALFASLSRSAWLALALGIFVYAAAIVRRKYWQLLKSFSGYIIVVAAVFFMLGFFYKNLVFVRVDSNVRLEQKSLDERVIYLEQAKVLIKQNPLFGTGIGNYIPALVKQFPDNPSWTYQPVHNVFLLIWAELGIFGVLMSISIYVNLIWIYGKREHAPLAILIALLPILLLDHWLWSLHFGILFFGLIIGISLKKQKLHAMI